MRLFSRAPDLSLDPSQFRSVVGDDVVGDGQQGSQLRLGRQITLDLQDEPLKCGELGSGHVGQSSISVVAAPYKITHCDRCL